MNLLLEFPSPSTSHIANAPYEYDTMIINRLCHLFTTELSYQVIITWPWFTNGNVLSKIPFFFRETGNSLNLYTERLGLLYTVIIQRQ